jgi:hypothetical protein
VLLLSEGFTTAGSVLHEWEIGSAQHGCRVVSLRGQLQLRRSVAKHIQAVKQGRERRRVAKQEAPGRIDGLFLSMNLLTCDED